MFNIRKSLLLAGILLFIAGLMTPPVPVHAEGDDRGGQIVFASPEAAVKTLVATLNENDNGKLSAIFGPEADELVYSGDPVADCNGRNRFLRAYGVKNFLDKRDDKTVVLHIGDGDYPFPIPIVATAEGWLFDTGAGREEILNRRVGRNELRVIEVLQAYTAAQREYACRVSPDNEPAQFARQLISSPDSKNGLYWPTAVDEEESPLGPLIAEAAEAGYEGEIGDSKAEPFHGYYFRVLTAQGQHATGGAFDYLVNGRMVLGFAMVAYPARYGSTGVKTFMVNQQGVIFEKDLGGEISQASTMTVFDPDASWQITGEAGL